MTNFLDSHPDYRFSSPGRTEPIVVQSSLREQLGEARRILREATLVRKTRCNDRLYL